MYTYIYICSYIARWNSDRLHSLNEQNEIWINSFMDFVWSHVPCNTIAVNCIVVHVYILYIQTCWMCNVRHGKQLFDSNGISPHLYHFTTSNHICTYIHVSYPNKIIFYRPFCSATTKLFSGQFSFISSEYGIFFIDW